MWICPKCGERLDDQFESCWKCAGRALPPGEALEQEPVSLPLSTTPTIPGRDCAETRGIVCGEAIMGANIFRDLVAGITDIIGGRSGVYENKLREARHVALHEMALEARALGADAVVGIDLDYETIGESMLMVTASGTAVRLKPAGE